MASRLPGLEGLEAHAEARGLLRPAGAGAVMADRARGPVAADNATVALWRKLEYFPTPPWAARAVGELVNALDPPPAGRRAWWWWEPTCGGGHFAHGLQPYAEKVYATDIHDHGSPLMSGPPLDFLSPAADAVDQADWIGFNPPFPRAAAFIAAALRRARRGVVCLARAALLESAGRYDLFFGAQSRFVAYAPFVERVPMVLGRYDPKASTATAYAAFVFMQPAVRAQSDSRTGRPLGDAPIVRPIPPGTKARLIHADDARLFGTPGAAPLLEPC